MKRSKIKLEEITDVENCKRAIIHASKRKRRRSNVRHILANIDEYAEKLRAFLMDEKAEFSEGIYEIINEGTNKKRRELCKPIFFPINVLIGQLCKSFSPCSKSLLIATLAPP